MSGLKAPIPLPNFYGRNFYVPPRKNLTELLLESKYEFLDCLMKNGARREEWIKKLNIPELERRFKRGIRNKNTIKEV